MAAKIEHIISDDGKVVRRTVTESALRITDDAFQTLVAGSPTKIKWVYNDPKTLCMDLTVKGPLTLAIAWLYQLKLKAPFRLVNNVLVPVFDSKVDPVMAIPFYPHAGCSMACITSCQWGGGGYQTVQVYFLMRDARLNYWLPPMPNLYEDGRVCHGTFAFRDKTSLLEICQQSIQMIEEADWNNHLHKPVEKTQAFFRFTPKNDGFETVPCPDWATHCTKIASEITPLLP